MTSRPKEVILFNSRRLTRCMSGEAYECPECGKKFGSEETLHDHFEMEHESVDFLESRRAGEKRPVDLFKAIRPYLNVSFALGLMAGFLITTAAFTGYAHLSKDRGVPVEITVVTCENCSYDRFRDTTDRLFNTRYEEVDYRSNRGRELITRYNLKYVPGFVYSKDIEEAKNFTYVRASLVEFDDAYVLADEGNRVAQRFSKGMQLE